MDFSEIRVALTNFFNNSSLSKEDFKNLGWGAARGAALAVTVLPTTKFAADLNKSLNKIGEGGLYAPYGACILSSLVGRVAIAYFSECHSPDTNVIKRLALSGVQEAVLSAVNFQTALLALTTIRAPFNKTYALCSILGGAAIEYFSKRPLVPSIQCGALVRIALGALEWTAISLANLKILNMTGMEGASAVFKAIVCMNLTASMVNAISTYFFQNLSLNKSAIEPLIWGGFKGFMLNNFNMLFASCAPLAGIGAVVGENGAFTQTYILMSIVNGAALTYFSKPLSPADSASI